MPLPATRYQSLATAAAGRPYHNERFSERQNFFETPATLTKTSWSSVEEVASGEWLVTCSECIRFLRVTRLIAKATYLVRCRGLRYQLIAKATYLVRCRGLRYQLIAKATYLVRCRGLRFSLPDVLPLRFTS